MAAMSPSSSDGMFDATIACSVPLTSGTVWLRFTRCCICATTTSVVQLHRRQTGIGDQHRLIGQPLHLELPEGVTERARSP